MILNLYRMYICLNGIIMDSTSFKEWNRVPRRKKGGRRDHRPLEKQLKEQA